MSAHPFNSEPTSVTPLRSELATDPDMVELIEFFLTELSQRIGDIRTSWEARDRQTLRRIIHQLKGAAGGYGYPSITQSAASLEHVLLDAEAESSNISEQIEELIQLCRRAAAGRPAM